VDNKEGISKWKNLRDFISRRTLRPFSHPEFIGYFILVIIMIGGIGVWSNLLIEDSPVSISKNLNAYSLAIISAGSIELIFTNNKVLKKTLTIISIGVLVVYIGLYFILTDDNLIMLSLSTLLSIFALYIWWIANAENTNLTENFFIENSNISKDLADSLSKIDEDA
jgi:hypothetical protein